VIAAVVWLLGLGAAAADPCAVSAVSVEGGDVTLSYDPFTPIGSDVLLVLHAQTAGDCEGQALEIVIAPDLSNPTPTALLLFNGSDSLRLGVFDRNNRPAMAPGGLAFTPGRAARVPLNGAGEVSSADALQLAIEPGQAARAGEYRARARALVRVAGGQDVASVPFDVVASVMPSVGLAAAGDMHLDLGEIDAGASAHTRFVAYANTDYELSVSSDHDWAVIGPNGARVPYDLTISGRPVLHQVSSGLAFGRPTSTGRRVHDMVASVTEFHRAVAGNYIDFVTIEISPRL
jgi:hypothetical protein